jgi:hypothetical protein
MGLEGEKELRQTKKINSHEALPSSNNQTDTLDKKHNQFKLEPSINAMIRNNRFRTALTGFVLFGIAAYSCITNESMSFIDFRALERMKPPKFDNVTPSAAVGQASMKNKE